MPLPCRAAASSVSSTIKRAGPEGLNAMGASCISQWKLTVVSAIALLTAGCAVGPNFQRPTAPGVRGYTSRPLPAQVPAAEASGVPSQQWVQNMDIPAQWWTLFHSPSLNQLVERALKANPTLDAARATLRQAQENVYAAEGTLLPSIDANAAATR